MSKFGLGFGAYLHAQGIDVPDDAFENRGMPNTLGLDRQFSYTYAAGRPAQHEARNENIWRDYQRGIGSHSLARKFDMTPSAISNILFKMRKAAA